jgi:hypothetical protein
MYKIILTFINLKKSTNGPGKYSKLASYEGKNLKPGLSFKHFWRNCSDTNMPALGPILPQA